MLSATGKKSAQLGLIVLMFLSAMMIWLGSPIIWLWIGSQVTSSQAPGFGPYMLVGTGILVSTGLLAYALARLNRAYEQVVGEARTVRVRLPWLRSLRDERSPATRLTVLDFILVLTALTAIATFAAWFLLFAGSSLPG
jgi:hypothetical protein